MVVATDDERIRSAVARYGIDVVMTRNDHPTGTDRLAEAAAQLGLDERRDRRQRPGRRAAARAGVDPRRSPSSSTEHSDAAIATACHPIADADEAFNPNVVKVVLDHAGYALYFSRATIPWARDAFAADRASAARRAARCTGTTGLYAYRVSLSCGAYPSLAPAPLERFEALEQLRALWHGYRIVVSVTRGAPAPGVDTQEDLDRVRILYAAGSV